MGVSISCKHVLQRVCQSNSIPDFAPSFKIDKRGGDPREYSALLSNTPATVCLVPGMQNSGSNPASFKDVDTVSYTHLTLPTTPYV